ncbi:MAG: archaemetzincin [Pyrinomonadaceae bacterium]
MTHKAKVAAAFLAALLTACANTEPPASNAMPPESRRTQVSEESQRTIESLQPFAKPKTEIQPGDWLESHNEPGQTFEEYINENPTLPTPERRKIYILPLGRFTSEQAKIIRITAGWLEAFYGLPTELLATQKFKEPLRLIDFRKLPYQQNRQVRTGYILDEILAPQLLADAAALIALTSEDLFPDPSMNYVFGQASLQARVGVWSLARLDDQADHDTFLRRTLKIAAHEVGHMFTIRHCTRYECVMNGSNHLGETDSIPVDACPECTAKIAWLSRLSPADRYQRLIRYARQNNLKKEAADFEQKLSAIRR